MYFVPNQNFTAIFFREAFRQPLAVLERAPWQVGRDAGVKRSAALTCHDVNARLLHRFSPNPQTMSYVIAQLRGAQRRSNPHFLPLRHGLLRFARNDGHPAPISGIASSRSN